MRKILISAVLAGSAFLAVSPAAAQWAPPVPQGYAYGYQGNYGQVRRLEARLQQIRNQIRHLDRRNILSSREARRLDYQARNLQVRIRQLGYNGLNGRERYSIERQIQNLEYRVRNEAMDRNNRYDRDGYGYNRDGDRDGYWDRDRDGRNDRYEDDRGYRHD